jgi:hypothetical protein
MQGHIVNAGVVFAECKTRHALRVDPLYANARANGKPMAGAAVAQRSARAQAMDIGAGDAANRVANLSPMARAASTPTSERPDCHRFVRPEGRP